MTQRKAQTWEDLIHAWGVSATVRYMRNQGLPIELALAVIGRF